MNSKLTAALAVILAAIMVVPCAAVCTSSAGETGVPDAVGSDYIDDGDISVGGTFDSDIKFGIDLSALETLGSIIYATLTAKTPYESQIVDKKVDTVVEIADDKVFSDVYEFGEGGKLVFMDGSNMLIDVSTDEMSHYFGVYSATEQTVFEFKAGSGIGLYLSGDGETEIEYTLTIDGEVIYDNITIGTIVYWADFDKTENRTLLGMVDGNGTSVGRVDIENGVWAYVYMVPYDLDLVTISGKEVTVSEGSNTFDSDAIVFQFPDTTENVTIGMDSGVVVELNPANYGSGDTVSVIVQAGTYNGYDAYLIEVRNGTYDGYATLYIPVDGDNYSLIHVADNGNVSKMYTKTVTIDGQMYLKVTANDFSVFYLHEEKEEMSETVIYVFAAILAIVCIGMLAFSIKKSGCS